MTHKPGPAKFAPGDHLVNELIEFWHTQDHAKLLDEAAADWLNSHLATSTPEVAGCHQSTFVGIEPVEDEHGEPTSATMVQASCSGNITDDCGWRKRLTAHDRSPADWWITSDEMATLHSEHMDHPRTVSTPDSMNSDT